MKRFLLEFYPVYPHSWFHIYQLDMLDSEYQPPSSDNHQQKVQWFLQTYEDAKTRYGPSRVYEDKLVSFNNSWWYMDEADDVFEFIEKYRRSMVKHAGSNEGTLCNICRWKESDECFWCSRYYKDQFERSLYYVREDGNERSEIL